MPASRYLIRSSNSLMYAAFHDNHRPSYSLSTSHRRSSMLRTSWCSCRSRTSWWHPSRRRRERWPTCSYSRATSKVAAVADSNQLIHWVPTIYRLSWHMRLSRMRRDWGMGPSLSRYIPALTVWKREPKRRVCSIKKGIAIKGRYARGGKLRSSALLRKKWSRQAKVKIN